MRVGINGFGRIGKLVYIILRSRGIDVPLVNDPYVKEEDIKYILTRDSVHKNKLLVEDGFMVNGKKTILTNEKQPENIKWIDYNIDVVIEASGVFTTLKALNMHNAPKIILTAPSSDIPMFVMGVNNKKYNGEKIISNSSCTTNCLAPLVKILDDKFNIIEGLMTTVHAVTQTQNIVDGVGKSRLCRSALTNIIPSTTGAAKAVGKIIPRLNNKLTGMSLRVPVVDVSLVDLTVRLEKEFSMDKLKKYIDEYKKEYKNIIDYTEDEVVSSDYISSEISSILDVKASIVLNDKFIKLLAWYDNEYAYSCRVVDLMEYIFHYKNSDCKCANKCECGNKCECENKCTCKLK
ncbi:Glyceraldehyde-3-phosphate dehydrogenase [Spraguea lophii 42_110]|uniref:glyceraldehyde-3-phosphate dehydrogenase (phosphorylating) n=1 Tax=Spraguea lophii (strain 42_110) TaxID=1358809 RepID=S7XIK1_SPRLO|nr:Glyceraldehyde-3-phosphate dehydrogenase [Spraguea lophii 42_110]